MKTLEKTEQGRIKPCCTEMARFSFMTPDCVRMEFAPSGEFVDEPSLFASHRPGDSIPYEEGREGEWLILRTDSLEVRYLEDGSAFHESNLRILSRGRDNGEAFSWHPGMAQEENLKGPLQTLDGIRGRVPMPDGLLSRDGWYVHDDSRRPLLVDGWIKQRLALPDAATKPSTYKLRSRHDWYFFGYGHDYQKALDALFAVSGKVPLPRRSLLGCWFSRWYPYTSDEYRCMVEDFDAHNIPLDVLVLDMDWHRLDAVSGLGMQDLTLGWTGYSWNRDLLPDAEKLIMDLKQDELTVCLNDHPHDGIRRHEDCYAEFMSDMGEPADDRDLPFQAGDKKYWHTFWKHSHLPKERDGVDFWWLDWQQDDILPFISGLGRLPYLPWLNALYYRESCRGGKRGQGMSRWGGLGDHKHPIHFSGDIESNWDAFAFEVEFTVRSSNSGCYFWSHDIGGFYGRADAELYVRWMQFGALSAALRLHSAGKVDRRPWVWDAPYDRALKDSMHLRARLMPYVYTAAWQCWNNNKPLLRPMYLEWPEAENSYVYTNQYLFGDNLLVSPVTQPADPKSRRACAECWLPPGRWTNWWTGEVIKGGQVIQDTYELERFPLYVRAGAVIPMQPVCMRPAVHTPASVDLHIFPGGEERDVVSLLYMDDGVSDPEQQPGKVWKFKIDSNGTENALLIDSMEAGEVNVCANERISYPAAAGAHIVKFDIDQKREEG